MLFHHFHIYTEVFNIVSPISVTNYCRPPVWALFPRDSVREDGQFWDRFTVPAQ